MKNIIPFIFLFLPFSLSAQDSQVPRSEIIRYVSYNQVKGDKLIRTDSVVLQINERAGDRDAEIIIPYAKGDKVTINDAWIEDAAGNVIRRLKSKDVDDRSFISDISLYEDDFVKSFELKHNTYPYRIVYSYKISYAKFLNIAALDYTDSRRPVRSGKLIVETPLDWAIKYRQINVDAPHKDTLGNTVCYAWEYVYAPEKPQINSSLNTSLAPQINVVPLFFNYGEKGSFDSWKAFGNWIYRLNRNRDELPASEKEKINKLLQGVDDKKEKARILYHYLQEYTRYINVSINIGGLQTYPASYVCTNKYGDCKALSNYMQAMLKYAGIDSYYTIINAGDKVVDVDPHFPASVFNHVIVTVPFGKDTVYLECTSKNTAFGYVGTSIQGRKALLIDENDSRLIDVPPLKPIDVLCTRHFNTNMNTAETKLKAVERGDSYQRLSFLMNEINKNLADNYIRHTILSGSYDLPYFNFEKEYRDSTHVTLYADLNIHNLYKQYGNNRAIAPFAINLPKYETPDKRTVDLQLDYPEHYRDTVVYELSDKSITGIPADVEFSSPFGHCSYKFELENNRLILYKSILINAGRYPLDVYEGFYGFIQTIKTNENKHIYLEVK